MSDALSERTRHDASADAALREDVQRYLIAGEIDRSIQSARVLLKERPGIRTLRFLRRLDETDQARAAMTPFRVALLSSFSIEFVHDALIAYGFINRLAITVYSCGFNSFRQEILDSDSGLYLSDPQLVVLAVEGEDWLPSVYGGGSSFPLVTGDDAGRAFCEEIGGLLRRFRDSSSAPLLIHNLAPPKIARLGILDMNYATGQSRIVSKLNEELSQSCSRVADIHVLDYAGLVARHGSSRWYDARMRLYARAPIAQPMLGELAREYIKYCRALVGLTRKCLVLDLDNTLWGGVIGEEGLDGIELGANYPGSAYVEFQRGIHGLLDRGVLLAIASKNNEQEVQEVFEKHPFMVLKRDDFAEFEVHWEPKNESLCRIARKLNIGLDQIVFVDDSAAECERVRSALPMVTVVQLPAQPERYLDSLFEDGWFDALSLSDEDKKRTALYKQRAEAEELRAGGTDIETYYRDLQMQVEFAPVTAKTLARVVQMTQKTNQFNATTRRYSDAEITRRMADPDWVLVTVSSVDRFGDNGIVGLVIARMDGESIDIDTFLLSCRVIARTIETAMLAQLCKIGRLRGAKSIRGTIIHTAKNAPVQQLFENHGFSREPEAGAANSAWRLDLDRGSVRSPTWIKVITQVADQPRLDL